MQVLEYSGDDFKVVKLFETWKIGILRYSERFSKNNVSERHLKSDEAFVLLEGEAVIYEENIAYKMEKSKIYNIKKGLWHHIVVSENATVLVVENSNTTKENTEKKYI